MESGVILGDPKGLTFGGFVYIAVDDEHLHKIGHARSARNRVEQLRSGGHNGIRLVYRLMLRPEDCSKVERFAHYELAQFRRDGEWFACGLTEAIASVERGRDAVANGWPEGEGRSAISVRLRPEVAILLLAKAKEMGIPHTTLVHRLVAEGLGFGSGYVNPRPASRPRTRQVANHAPRLDPSPSTAPRRSRKAKP